MASDRTQFERDLASVDWSKTEHAYGAATNLPDVLRALWSDDWELLSDTWCELLGNVWHQSTVYGASADAIAALLSAAECDACPGRNVAAGILAFIASGSPSDNAAAQRIRAAFDFHRGRIENLSQDIGPAGDACRIIRRAIDGAENIHDEVTKLGDEIEAELSETERAARAATRTPARLREELAALRFDNREDELKTLSKLSEALNLGLADEVLEVHAKLRHASVHAESLRIRALAATGAKDAARRAALGLARRWLEPPESTTDASQVLTPDEIIAALKSVHSAGDTEVQDMLLEVAGSTPQIFFGPGEVF